MSHRTDFPPVTDRSPSRAPAAPRGATGPALPAGPSVAPVVAAISLLGMLVVGQLYVAIPLLPDIGRAWGWTRRRRRGRPPRTR